MGQSVVCHWKIRIIFAVVVVQCLNFLFLQETHDILQSKDHLTNSFPEDKIQDCYEKRGRDIEISNAKQTPSHPGVPFVLIDGSPVDDFLQTKEIICKRLEEKGAVDPLPKACRDTTTAPTTTTSHIRFNMERLRQISLS